MLGRIIAGTAVAGALAFGAAGIAGATTPASSSTSSTSKNTTSTTLTPAQKAQKQAAMCSFLKQVMPEVQAFAGDLNSAATQAQDVASQAKSAGYTKFASSVSKRVKWVESHEKQLGKRLQKVEARCSSTGGSSNGSSNSSNSGSTS